MANVELKKDAFSLAGLEFTFVLWGWKFSIVAGIKAAKEVKE
jgi:hypothetical protein